MARATAALLLAAAGLGQPGLVPGSADIVKAGVPPEGVLIEWLFTETEDPWRKGVSGAKGSADWGTVYSLDDDDEGWIQFDGVGNRGRRNAWLFLTLTLPVGARTLQFDASGHDRPGADANFKVRIVEDGDSTTLFDRRVTGGDDYRWRTHEVDIRPWSGREVTLFFEQDDDGDGEHEQVVLDNVRILGLVTCAISGRVTDGDENIDPHENPLPGIRLQLWTGGADSTPVGPPVASDAEGRYCIPSQEGVTDPGNYKLRATLVDALNDPPLLLTRRTADTEAAWTEIPIAADDFGSEQVDITFTGTPDRPWLPDLGYIHLHSDRYVRWATQALAISNATFETVTISAFDADGTRYRDADRMAFIDAADSVYDKRGGPNDECPENCEWHEIAHHIAHRMGIAETTASSGPCTPREPHGGWLNKSTCDSLAEGWATFLAVLGSVDIDRGGAPGYGTPEYSSFGVSLEDNTYKPWTAITGASGRVAQEEDFTVAQLLWDLQDANSDEQENIPITGSPDSSLTELRMDDLVALTGVELVHIMDAAEPQTVADLYAALVASPDVPADLKVRDPAFAEEAVPPDITPLQEAFLMHGFHPVRDETAPRFELSDRVAYTDHVPQPPGYVERPHMESLPGSALRLANPTGADRTFVIEVDYPSTSSRFEVVVPAGGEELFGLTLPPNPWVVPRAGEPPAACDDPDSTITVTVSAGDVEAQSFDNCAFNQALFTTTGDAALAFGEAAAAPSGAAPTGAAATGGPAATAAPSPAGSSDGGTMGLVAVVAAAAITLIGLGAWLARRRRTTT